MLTLSLYFACNACSFSWISRKTCPIAAKVVSTCGAVLFLMGSY